MTLRVKRVYEAPSPEDGTRILVDRLWPRGLSKEKAHVDFWLKEIAPSTELRKWFNHEPEKWDEFRRRYRHELRERQPAFDNLLEVIGKKPATLLFGSKEERFNDAVALKEFILAHRK
jgi:uncharacterized protein YeaO (DUF488 family)